MNRPRLWCAFFLFLALLAGQTLPEPSSAEEKKEAEKWLVDKKLALTPRAAPVPALKYRLFPLMSERKEGNAVPIYLRLTHERSDAARRRLSDIPTTLDMPLAEAKKLLADHRGMLQQLELGARRKTADWAYTLDQGSVIDIALPDAQSMRNYAKLLALKARVEVIDGDFTAATHTLETGFAFSRHVADGPFLINGLIGVACAGLCLHRVPEFIERPDAPNLYWALSALPRPLIDMRGGLEFEQRFPEMQFPDLADLDRKRTPEQWDTVLVRVRTELERISEIERGQDKQPTPAGTAATTPASKSPDLAIAKRYLTDRRGMTAADVDAMPPAQILVLYLAGYYRELSDDMYKASYLPYAEGQPVLAEAQKRLQAAPGTEAARFARLWLGGTLRSAAAQNRLERQVALYRTIEAIRMHAADHDGQLPEKLSEVTVVPVPGDPGTGQPFEYRRDGDTATLSSRIPSEPLQNTGLRYHLVIRKK
jgi:hypothetical protein